MKRGRASFGGGRGREEESELSADGFDLKRVKLCSDVSDSRECSLEISRVWHPQYWSSRPGGPFADQQEGARAQHLPPPLLAPSLFRPFTSVQALDLGDLLQRCLRHVGELCILPAPSRGRRFPAQIQPNDASCLFKPPRLQPASICFMTKTAPFPTALFPDRPTSHRVPTLLRPGTG